MSVERLRSNGRTSQIVMTDTTVYLAGQVARNPANASVREQAADAFLQVEELLAECGSGKSKLLHVTVFLADRQDFNGMNEAWVAWIDPANPPARATVQATLLDPEWKIEVVAVAAR